MQPVGASVFEGTRVNVIPNRDDEYSWPGLGNPTAGVKKHGADFVESLAKRLVHQVEIIASIGGKQADHIFESNNCWFDRHFVENAEPLPEEAAAGCGEAAHFSGKGEVLTGEAGPDDVAPRNLSAADVFNGSEMEMIVAVVRGVDSSLLRADVVRPDGETSVLGTLGDKATACKEIYKGWKLW